MCTMDYYPTTQSKEILWLWQWHGLIQEPYSVWKKKSVSEGHISVFLILLLNYATYGTLTVMWNRLVIDERQEWRKGIYKGECGWSLCADGSDSASWLLKQLYRSAPSLEPISTPSWILCWNYTSNKHWGKKQWKAKYTSPPNFSSLLRTNKGINKQHFYVNVLLWSPKGPQSWSLYLSLPSAVTIGICHCASVYGMNSNFNDRMV